jgi:hypothetical protein
MGVDEKVEILKTKTTPQKVCGNQIIRKEMRR